MVGMSLHNRRVAFRKSEQVPGGTGSKIGNSLVPMFKFGSLQVQELS